MEKSVVKYEQDSSENDDFEGYTIDELRYRRAMVALQAEYAKEHVLNNIHKIQKHGITGGEGSKLSRVSGVAGKLLSGLNYLDYVMIGMTLFGQGRKIFKLIRGKKK